MTNDLHRIIEAVKDEVSGTERPVMWGTPILTALANLATSGVCPKCGRKERMSGIIYGRRAGEPDMRTKRCADIFGYHDHREALDALLAEREAVTPDDDGD